MLQKVDGLPDLAAWWRLAHDAPEPSGQAAPALALAAWRHLPAGKRPVLVHDCDGAGACRFVAPVRESFWRWRPLGRLVSTRFSDFFFLGVPLLSADDSAAAVRALLQRLRARGNVALELCTVPEEGAFWQLVRRAAPGKPVVLARWRRAVLDATRDPEEWWRRDVSSKRRKEYRRLWKRLQQQGRLEFQALAEGEDVRPWLEDFLALEASGWKGRAGTAIACDAHNAAFVRRMVTDFHAHGALRFWRLTLDGRWIAGLFGLMVQDVLWLGKIARDESLDAFSPGVLLTIEATRRILADPAIRLADSSADPDHPMIDHLWRQRQTMVDALVPLPGVSTARFQALLALERVRRAARAKAKVAWHRLRKQHRRGRRSRT